MQPPSPRGHLVLIGGSVRAAAGSAVRDGWEVSAVDMFGDVDTCRLARTWHRLTLSTDLDRMLQQLPPGPVIVTGGMEQWYPSLDRVRLNRPVLAASSACIERLRDPAFLRRVALRSGFRFPRCSAAGMAELPPGWLAKSRASAGGLAVTRSAPDSPGPDDYFQQQVSGRPFGAAFLATDSGTRLLGVTRSLTCTIGPHPYLYAGSLGPIAIDAADRSRLLRLADRIRQQVDLRGLFGVDLIADGSSLCWLLEINPRITASMELLEPPSGPSLITCHVQAYAAAHGPSASPAMELAVNIPTRIKRVVWSRESFRWDPRWQHSATAGDPGVVIRDLPQPGASIPSGQPVVSICAAGRQMSDCVRAAARVERRLRRLVASAD